jgi:hypothetical protein
MNGWTKAATALTVSTALHATTGEVISHLLARSSGNQLTLHLLCSALVLKVRRLYAEARLKRKQSATVRRANASADAMRAATINRLTFIPRPSFILTAYYLLS